MILPCFDCGVDTKINEYYMVYDSVWPIADGYLCIGCLEARIGRQLTCEDFTLCPGNFIWRLSERLQQRMEGIQERYDAATDEERYWKSLPEDCGQHKFKDVRF